MEPTPCIRCEKPIKGEWKYAVEVIRGGAMVRKDDDPAMLAAARDDGPSYMGWFPVGRDCRKALEAEGVRVVRCSAGMPIELEPEPTPRYIACPECHGASHEWDDPRSSRHGETCSRCRNFGSLRESEATPDEIEASRRAWEADAEARDRVDFQRD